MVRPLCIEFAGALYHVTARGNRREPIFLPDADRLAFHSLLGEVCDRFNWSAHAWCQMGNHYHLLLETPDGNLSAGMRQFNGVYTQRFNARNRRVGHPLQGRYHAILIQKEAYLLEVARYVVLNPVRARMVRWEFRGQLPKFSTGSGIQNEFRLLSPESHCCSAVFAVIWFEIQYT